MYIPWIAANTSPHSKDNGCCNQTVFHNKRIQVRCSIDRNFTQDVVSATREIIGYVDNALVPETICKQDIIWNGFVWVLDIFFLSNRNIHKSSHGLCF